MLRCITFGARFDDHELKNLSNALRKLDKTSVKDVTVLLRADHIWHHLRRGNTEVMREIEKVLLAFARPHLVFKNDRPIRLRRFSWEGTISAAVPELRRRGALVWDMEYSERSILGLHRMSSDSFFRQ